MPLSVGDKLGPYEILAPIGAGGMGVVYKARDTRLDRIVAIKVSQAEFSERFEREARAVAALNHPNICHLYDVGSSPEAPGYLVMEFVDGSPIAPVDGTRKLLDLAVQIADGLTSAHGVPIVHRDLKPDNILVTHEGRVKILDFGLAKAAAVSASAAEATRTMGITDPGTTVGTVNYMSPEQARGMELAPQSDQFSFGLVLYELATGNRPFRRGSAPETMAAIIREEAEPLPVRLPAPLRWTIERLLAKEPSERYDSTRDLYRELKQIRDRLSESTSAAHAAAAGAGPKRKRLVAPLAIGAACLVVGAAAAALLLPRSASGPDLSRYRYTPLTQGETEERGPRWSPDGKSIVYTARIHGIMQAFTRGLGSDSAQVTRAEQNCSYPFWSPDGALVYYVSGGDLWSVPAAGGAAQMVYRDVSAAALHPDGKTLAFKRGRKIWIGSLNGGAAREFWQGPANGGLNFSPDGSKLAVNSIGPICVLPYPSGAPQKFDLGIATTAPSWFPDSRHLAVFTHTAADDAGMLSVLDVTGGSRRIIAATPTGFTYPSVSPDGKRILYTSGRFEWDVLEISIPNGQSRTLVAGGVSNWPDWAPSGTHFIFAAPLGEHPGIYDRQAGEEGFSRQLVEADGVLEPHWSPDGKRFVFDTEFHAESKFMLVNASGGGSVLLDSTRAGQLTGMSWSPDGQWISYIREIAGKLDLAKIRAASGAAPEVLANAKVQQQLRSPTAWSPTGDWIAYPAPDGIDLISPDGKSGRNLTARKFQPYGFSRDGGQLYGVYHNTTGQGEQWQLYSVNVNTGAERFLAPVDLPPSADVVEGFSLHPDGKRFLVSIAKFPFGVWMLQGFDPPQPGTWFDRLLRR
jgi:Tol biopolymer transport system component/tRNA A-37 threonylcarbamoyl transferase component Bud32